MFCAQEEAPAYGVHVLVMRDTPERPEGVDAGILKLVGTNEEVIYNEFTKLLDNKEEYAKMALRLLILMVMATLVKRLQLFLKANHIRSGRTSHSNTRGRLQRPFFI